MSASSVDGAEAAPRPEAASALARLAAFARRPDVSGMAVVVAVKAIMVGLNFTLIALAARALDTEGFGYYSILFSAAGLLLIVAAAGQELFVIRSWSEFTASKDAARTRGLLRFSLAVCAAAGAVVAAGFLAWAVPAFGAPTALAVAGFFVVGAMLQISNHLVRAAVGVASGDGLGSLLQAAPAIAYLGAALATGSQATIAGLFSFLALGTLAGFVAHVAIMRRQVLRLFPGFGRVRAVVDRAQWLGRSSRLWASNTLEAMNQHLDVLVIGYLMSPTVAGAYFVTVRLANLFAAAADSINLFATRHFARLYFGGDGRELEKLLDSVAWITLAFIGIGMVGIASGGYFVLLVINEAYTAYFPELLILCLGTAALAVARPCGSILMLTGHEGRYLRIIAASVAFRVAALFVLVPALGVLGAVTATAASFVVAAAAMRRSAKATTGLDATVVRLVAKRRDAYAASAT